MGLDIIHLVWRHARVGVGRAQHGRLRGRIRGHQPVGSAILIERRTPHHGQHPVPVAQRIAQSLEHHYAAALAPHEPVRGRIESVHWPVVDNAPA